MLDTGFVLAIPSAFDVNMVPYTCTLSSRDASGVRVTPRGPSLVYATMNSPSVALNPNATLAPGPPHMAMTPVSCEPGFPIPNIGSLTYTFSVSRYVTFPKTLRFPYTDVFPVNLFVPSRLMCVPGAMNVVASTFESTLMSPDACRV